ncbi:glycoside hydrolase family 88 protein [Singulisphaera acidiphila]|uniref:Putative unsaturated glucuronyl hydrolase n=1 Tax=Singulisphaera acidiphila (strain ATCC BAA-1392 / DSM 18658 / VKM B-2454 / MOB10) TaxID=886293 RepID=L0D6W0_SINAD|nr:glycoside hydrolase family 88 protein [Singulisphaera acidiphila]AGA25144.1 putative unsaturated glucuronyl hydrolase [Singulisphaera acidiphila DSM 18658]
MAEPREIDLADLKPRLERAFDFAGRQVRATIERTPDYFPIYTVEGRWKHEGELWTDWCAGFHAGMMWLLAERDGDPWWRAQAEHYSKLIEHKQHDREVHDLGFIFMNTYLPWYRLTGDPALRKVLIQAGQTLALRFNPRGKYLRSFVAPESLFIDIMMNVPIMFYVAKETNDDALYDLAVYHCRTTERTLVRPDGGTAHEGIFDLRTGAFLRQTTHQGLSGESDWTRGLAWSLYGYGTVFSYTKNPVDLAVAERNADHFIERCPEGLIPPWDFDVPPGPDRIDDSSAGAIAASGLWNLAELTDDPDRARRYRNASLTILDTLCTDHYLAWNKPGWEGVLMHGVYHFHKKLGVDESVMWGEYFFLEAVAKVLGIRKPF